MENKCVTHLKPRINCLLCFFVCVLGLWRGCDKEKIIMMSKWNALRWIPDCCLVIFFLTSLPMCACHDCWTYADTQNDKVYRSKRSKIPMIVKKAALLAFDLNVQHLQLRGWATGLLHQPSAIGRVHQSLFLCPVFVVLFGKFSTFNSSAKLNRTTRWLLTIFDVCWTKVQICTKTLMESHSRRPGAHGQ